MPLYISPIVAAVQGILTKYIAQVLDNSGYPPFVSVGTLFTWVMNNPPQAWVDGVKTQLDDSGNSILERHLITIKFGVTGTDPDDIAASAKVYMKAICDAIALATPQDWGEIVPNRAFVVEHDYGPLWVKESVLSRFPEAHLEVEVNEVG
jgi:hypothetical protein